MVGCVPMKKYNDVKDKARLCEEELNALKDKAINFETKSNELDSRLNTLLKEATQLKLDTTNLGELLRDLRTKYGKLEEQNTAYEKRIEHDRATVAKSAGSMQAEMDAKSVELHRKQDVLKELEEELKEKQRLLADREKRVNELEEMMQRKDDAVKMLQKKVADALLAYKNRGLTVVNKNGKIYVSLEAKLLFKTGSTDVEPDGKTALIDLAKVLENEKELEIVVEGHTGELDGAAQGKPLFVGTGGGVFQTQDVSRWLLRVARICDRLECATTAVPAVRQGRGVHQHVMRDVFPLSSGLLQGCGGD